MALDGPEREAVEQARRRANEWSDYEGIEHLARRDFRQIVSLLDRALSGKPGQEHSLEMRDGQLGLRRQLDNAHSQWINVASLLKVWDRAHDFPLEPSRPVTEGETDDRP